MVGCRVGRKSSGGEIEGVNTLLNTFTRQPFDCSPPCLPCIRNGIYMQASGIWLAKRSGATAHAPRGKMQRRGAWKHIQTHSYTFSTVIKAMQPIITTLSTIASRRIRLRAHTFAHARCAPATMGRGSHSASAATREQLITKVSQLYIPSQVAYSNRVCTVVNN